MVIWFTWWSSSITVRDMVIQLPSQHLSLLPLGLFCLLSDSPLWTCRPLITLMGSVAGTVMWPNTCCDSCMVTEAATDIFMTRGFQFSMRLDCRPWRYHGVLVCVCTLQHICICEVCVLHMIVFVVATYLALKDFSLMVTRPPNNQDVQCDYLWGGVVNIASHYGSIP